ncbi:hypothetical protein [Acidocella aminolytica]|uniref:Uncharacterized protein n=1 Tax=Acidocella aminolytica 101 = DSM 11237 TaxID=1120923 RepID=A0A0D6PDP8_9PROT|nr:hypothetical protein [Acidocella aminolytica]GAN79782.1 hypothetical protein Aam_030_015 [Acidocella aminolytica 101 = DSM 11237]GBQ32039.1 hypothetical protein AA11237_0050 [Acidocella aminolytica 101 = DSM 11237]SHF35677.1 hypothetical protein SAMN02746095_02950 [Acidocella aminolytica 101 = DSM 11237]
MTQATHGATIVQGGMVSDQATTAQILALATPGMSTGTPTSDFTLIYKGRPLSFRNGIAFTADAMLKAAMAGQPVTWSS